MNAMWLALMNFIETRSDFVREFRFHLTPAADISNAKHVQLLEMTYDRLVYSFRAMPFVALAAVGVCSVSGNPWPLSIWALGYAVAYVFSQQRVKAYEADKTALSEEALLAHWRPRLKKVVGLHGLALNIPFVLTVGQNFEFTTFWYLTVGAIVALNATHQTPVLGVFSRFLSCTWNVATVLVVWNYPDHWPYIGLAILAYTFGIYRHSLSAHKFFLQQMRLEENSNKLAEQFKLAKETAENALQEKNRFLATASHDLRQPVHAMGMLIQAVLQQNKDPALNPALNDLNSSVRTMSTLFNSLLDLSRLESGIRGAQARSVNLRKSAREAMALFEADAAQRGLSLRLHLPRRHIMVQTDPNLLHQILINLLQNALRYTPKGGILLGIRARAGQWRIEVWDTGVGVAENIQRMIYLPYFRPKNAWHVDSAGHGLGLAVVARCAQLLDAQYGLDSRLGRGSRFWVSLPKAPESEELPQALDWAAVTGAHTVSARQLPVINTGRCLIVEDDPQVCEAWKMLLAAWGVSAMFASHSAQATGILDAGFEPQVILCDERLRSGESGFELLQALLQRLPQAHGAMVSGEFSSSVLQRAEDEGYLVLRKPVEMELMHSLLSRWLIKE